MIIKATQKNTRQPARKVRLVANTVKKLPLVVALKQLAVIERKSTIVVLKVLRQAVANAIHNHGFELGDLSIKTIVVTKAPTLKRFRAVSRGRAHTILKRTSHVTVELEANKIAPKPVSTQVDKKPVVKKDTSESSKQNKTKPVKKTTVKKTSSVKKTAVSKKAVKTKLSKVAKKKEK